MAWKASARGLSLLVSRSIMASSFLRSPLTDAQQAGAKAGGRAAVVVVVRVTFSLLARGS